MLRLLQIVVAGAKETGNAVFDVRANVTAGGNLGSILNVAGYIHIVGNALDQIGLAAPGAAHKNDIGLTNRSLLAH